MHKKLSNSTLVLLLILSSGLQQMSAQVPQVYGLQSRGTGATSPCKVGTGTPVGILAGTLGDCYFQSDAPSGVNIWGVILTGTPATWAVQSGGSTCPIVRTSATVITLAPNASSSNPCVLNGARFTAPVPYTDVANSGTLYAYVEGTTQIAGYGGGTFVSGNVTSTVATAVFGITLFPPALQTGVVQLFTATSTAGNWDANGITVYLSAASMPTFLCGNGVNCAYSGNQVTVSVPTLTVPTGTSITMSGSYMVAECTSTPCNVTLPVPSQGPQYCVRNATNVAAVITLLGLGSSARYERPDHTAYGTASTGTGVSAGTILDQICVIGKDGTHYDVWSVNNPAGWTMN